MGADLNLAASATFAYLDLPRTEHDRDGHIVGAAIAFNPMPHRYTNADAQMFAWCALDTLLVPMLFEQTGRVESTSPVSSATVRLSVGPAGVADRSPPDAVVSLPVVDASDTDTSSVEAIWRTFCHRSYFLCRGPRPSHGLTVRTASRSHRSRTGLPWHARSRRPSPPRRAVCGAVSAQR
jgi:hypothetical protein